MTKNKPQGLLSVILILMYLTTLYYFVNLEKEIPPLEKILSAFLISIPLITFYFSVGLLCVGISQKEKPDEKVRKLIHTVPRISSLLIALFLLLFSLDVFEAGGNIWAMLLGFVLHSIPSMILGVFVFFSWKKPSVGFFGFLIIALLFVLMFVLQIPDDLGLFIIVGPLLTISGLFWLDWKMIQFV